MEFHLIDFIQHIVNIVLLFLLLRTFIYKPVSDFMEKRKAKFAMERRALESEQEGVDQLKARYQGLLDDARVEAEAITEDKLAAAEKVAADIRVKAEAEANAILEKARSDARAERLAMLDDVKAETVDLAIRLSEQLLAREISEQDNSILIDSFFEQVK